MDYIALYRKWRPVTFDEVVEQESVVTILKNTVKSRRIGHAYLFCGTRGTGKTTVAKIFSRAINCLDPVDGSPCNKCEICRGILNESILDVAEIDAASNNGVDSIRAIIDESSYQASRAEYKVYIIDEVHMLSVAAFNALLKTLEEPPEKVVFILATTEPQKLPVTILSRCQRFNFNRISRDGIVARLEEICVKTGLRFETEALRLIAGKADGGLRDAISLLDQTIAFSEGNVTLAEARKATGSIDNALLEDFTGALLSRDGFKILTMTDGIFAAGADPSNFISEITGVLRNLMICLLTRSPKQFIYANDEDIERLKALAGLTNVKEISMLIKELSALENQLKWSIQRKIVFEAGMLSLCDRNWGKETELADRVQTLERSVADLVNNGLKVVPEAVHVSSAQPVIAEKKENNTIVENVQPIEAEPEETVETSLTKNALASLRPVDAAAFGEFVNVIREKYMGVAGYISTQCDAAYIVGNALYLPMKDEASTKLVTDGKRQEMLNYAALRTFNRPLNVIALTVDRFYEQAPELKRSAEAQTDAKEIDEDELANLAESLGVSLEIIGDKDKSKAPRNGSARKESGRRLTDFDATDFEPNSSEPAAPEDHYGDEGYGEDPLPPPPPPEEDSAPVYIPQPPAYADDFYEERFDGDDDGVDSLYGGDDD